jgi:ABC-type bacteriocin/lantibiotic exporter with double-glycine peptidase domain
VEKIISDLIQDDPYAGVETEEERQAIYQNLLAQHETATQEYERKKRIYDDFSGIWDIQRNIQIGIEERFHKNILMLAAGSFGVSFAFINQVIPLKVAFQTNILFFSWLFFGLSLIIAILEPRINSLVQDILLNAIEKNIDMGYEGKPYKKLSRLLVMLPTRILNWAAFALFMTGVLCLLNFVYINVVAR